MMSDRKFCPTCGQPPHDEHDTIRHTGEGKVTIGLTAADIEILLTSAPTPSLIVRMLKAMQLIDEARANRLAADYEIALLPKK